MRIKNWKLRIENSSSGQAVMTVVVFFLFISLTIISGAVVSASKEIKNNRLFLNGEKSFFLSEAGVEDAVYRIKTGRQIGSEEVISLDGNQVTTTISDISGGKKIIANTNFGGSVRNIQTQLSASIGFDFFYGAQVGEGGVDMEENSRIEGVGGAMGNVYSNGPIKGKQGSTITGDATVATGLQESASAKSTVCSSPPDGDQIVGQSNPQIDFAQSFSASDSKPLFKVSLYIKKVGSPSDRDVLIVADDNGLPAQNYLAKSNLQSSLVGTDYAWINVVFSNPAALTNNTTYWIVLDARKDQNKYWIWCKDKDQGYGNGVGMYSQDWDDDPWSSVVGDLNFKIYLGVGISSIEDMNILGTAMANTISDSSIGGDAYYQTISNSTVSGTSYPGSDDPSPLNMPVSDANIASWKQDASAGGDNNSECGGVSPCNYVVSDDESLGPIKITGDLLMTSTNKTLTITGTVYVEGDIDIDNGSTIQCDTSFGADSCIILTDGWIHVRNNGIFMGSGQAESYIMMLSTLACDGSSFSPPCDDAHHNGAIDLHNRATGAIFYANAGLIHMHNGVDVTGVTAYKLELDNNAVVSYETGVINSSFSSGPGGSWNITSWREIE